MPSRNAAKKAGLPVCAAADPSSLRKLRFYIFCVYTAVIWKGNFIRRDLFFSYQSAIFASALKDYISPVFTDPEEMLCVG